MKQHRKVTLKLLPKISLVLLSLSVAVGQDEFVNVPLTGPLTSLSSAPVNERPISGELLWNITNGDFVHPTFSPDGNTLAYGRVLTRKGTESTAIFLHRLPSNQTSVLLTSAQAFKYATYKAAVSSMTWPSRRRLEAEIHDGDVDSTRLIFDPSTRRLIRDEYVENYVDTFPDLRALPRASRQARQRAVSLFPEIPQNVLDNALLSSALVVPDKGILLQDGHILFLDFETKAIKRLVALPEKSGESLRGRVNFGGSILFVIVDEKAGYLFQYRQGKIRCLTRIQELNYTSPGDLDVKYQTSGKIIFQIKIHPPYEEGDNPLFMFDGNELTRVSDYKNLYDADIDPQGKRIAFCYWQRGKRVIAIKALAL